MVNLTVQHLKRSRDQLDKRIADAEERVTLAELAVQEAIVDAQVLAAQREGVCLRLDRELQRTRGRDDA